MRRTIKDQSSLVTDPNEVASIQHNPYVGAQKTMEMGHKFTILGALDTARGVGRGLTVGCFNNSAAVVFVATGDASMAAPTGPADGIPVPAYSYVFVALGQDNTIISNSANCFGYLVQDDTVIR